MKIWYTLKAALIIKDFQYLAMITNNDLKINKRSKKVIVAMSGGVDSSVAAKLLVDQGYEVVGIFLHFWQEDSAAIWSNVTDYAKEDKTGKNLIASRLKKNQRAGVENKCCSTKALNDARRVCQKIGIPLYTMNFSEVFKKKVVGSFLFEYKIGNTPNPCIVCNKKVKLGQLIEKAEELGFDYVATGHYAKIKKTDCKISNNSTTSSLHKRDWAVYSRLIKAEDAEKDQSYFLHTLNQRELARLIFPIGEYTKSEVRALAKKFKLPVAEKKESQEICFIPEKSHNDFLKRHIRMKPGAIKLLTSRPSYKDGGRRELGQHQGLPLYTFGQRKGIEIGGTGPYYVACADYKTNILYVVSDGNDKKLFSRHLIAKNFNWLSGQPAKMPFKCEAVIRYRHQPAECVVRKNKNGSFKVEFNKPQRAVTSGQSVVLYKKDEVLGGGVIK